MQRRLVIVEPAHTGHRLHYVRTLADKAIELSIAPVLATSSEALASEEFQRVLGHGNALYKTSISFEGGLRRRLSDVRRIARDLRSDDVLVFPNMDEYTLPLVLVTLASFRMPASRVTGIVMRPPESRNVKGLVKRLLIMWLRVRHAKVYILQSPFASEHFTNRDDALFDDSGLMHVSQKPDFTLDTALAEWKDRDPRPVVTITGVLDRRKSIAELLNAAEQTREFRVLLAGQLRDASVANKVNSTIERLPKNDMYVVPRYLTHEEFEAVLGQSDILSLLYTNSAGSSGLVAHAMRRQIPVLGFGNVTVTHVVERYGSGTVIASLSPQAIAAGVKNCRQSGGISPEMLGILQRMTAKSWRDLLARAIETSSIS